MGDELDLDAIQAMCDAATAAPWTIHADGTEVEAAGVDSHVCQSDYEFRRNVNWDNDALFIAASRTLIPQLVQLVRDQAAIIHDLREEKGGNLHRHPAHGRWATVHG